MATDRNIIRDQFAMAALQGLCADPSNYQLFKSMDELAIAAYEIANAMLAERDRWRNAHTSHNVEG